MTDSARSDPPERPHRRRRRLILIATVVLVAVIGLAAAIVAWNRDRLEAWLHRALEEELSAAIGGTAAIGELDLRLLRLEATLTDLTLEGPLEGGGTFKGQARAARLRLAWRGLASLKAGRLWLSEVWLDRPVLAFERVETREEPPAGIREGAAFDWRIDQLGISGGELRYVDLRIPVDMEVRDVELRGTWGTFRRALIGELSSEIATSLPRVAAPYTLAISGQFRLLVRRIELLDLAVTGPGLEIQLDRANIPLEKSLAATAVGTGKADLGVLSRSLLREDLPPIAGRLQGDLFISTGAEGLHVSGDYVLSDAVVGPFRASRVTARADYQEGRLILGNLSARTLGGDVTGEAEIGLEEPFDFGVRVRGEGLEVRSLTRLAGREVPVSSRAAVDLELEGILGRLESWKGSAQLDADPVEDPSGLLPVAATATLTLEGGTLEVAPLRIEGANEVVELATRFDIQRGVPVGSFTARGEFTDASRTQETVFVVADALEVELPEAARRPVTGRGAIDARLNLEGEPAAAVALRLEDGGWGGATVRLAEIELRYDGGIVRVLRAVVEGHDWRLEGDAEVQTDPLSLTSLDMNLENFPLEMAPTLIGDEIEIEGRVNGSVAISRGAAGLDGAGRVDGRGIRLWGETLESIDTVFEIERDLMTISRLVAQGSAIEVGGAGTVDLGTGVADGALLGDLDLSEVRALVENNVRAEGTVRFEGPLRWTPDGPEGRLRLSGPAWRLGGFDLGDVDGELDIGREGATMTLSTGEKYGLTLEGHLAWGGEWPLTAVLYLDGTQVDYQVEGLEEMWGRLSGEVVLNASLRNLGGFGLRGNLETGEFHLGAAVIRTGDRVPFSFLDGRLDAGPATIEGTDTELTARVAIDSHDWTVDASCTGGIGLNIVSAAWPALRASGRLDVDVRVGGTLTDLDFQGVLGVDGGRVRVLGFPAPLNDVDLAVRLDGSRAELERLRARLGGGEVTGEGFAQFEGVAPASYEVNLDVANARLVYPEGFRGVYDGRLVLSGAEGTAAIRGDLTLLRGAYQEEFDFIQLMTAGSREYDVTSTFDLPLTLDLDIDLRADGNVWVRNDLAELEVGLDLHVGGEAKRPEVTGRVWLYEGGKIFFRRVDYEIESGGLDFTELEKIDPYIDIRARTRVSDYEIRLQVDGTLEELNYRLTSDPPLSAPDIIALLTTGRTLEDVSTSGSTTGFTGDVVANYFAGALTGSFEKQIQDLLRLERVWIDPLLVQGIDPTARVTLGKEVADDLFLVYSFDVGGPTAGQQYRLYQVEWQANRKIRVVVGNSTVGGVSGDVRYTTRFMGRRGKHEPAGVPAVPEPEIHDPAFRPHEGEPVLSVVVQVPRDEGQRQIEDDLPLKAGDVYRRSALFEGAHRIRRRFVRQDRIEARVLAEAVRQDSEESGVHVRYEVDPGPSVKIETEGVEKKKDRRRIRERLEQLWIDSIFQEEIYQDAVEVIVEYFHERGYYAADAVYEESMTDDVRTVRFVVDTGEPVKVQSVEIRGADNLSEEQIQRQMLTRPATAFARRLLVPGELRDDVAAIVNLYRDHGYLAVRVEPPQIRLSATGWSARIVLTIDEGPNYKVAEISVPPDLPFSAELIRQWIELDPGDVFSPRKLIEAEGALRAQLDRQGYPNARVGSRVAIDNGEVRVGFEVSLGEIQRLGDVRIEGARATKPRVIQREVNDHIQTGDLISRNALLEIQHRLYRLGIFRSVRLSLEPMEGDATLQTLVIQVQESPPIGLMVGGGYDTEGGIGGVFSISHANPGGRNRTVAFQGRANSIEQSLQLALDDPRFLGKRYTSLTNLLWKKREGRAFTEDRRIFSFRVERTPKPKLLEFVRYSFQKVDLSDVTDEQAAREEKLEDLTLGSVTYGRAWTTRRDLFVATDGTLASGEVSLFAKAIGSDAQFWKIYLQGTKDFPIRRRQTFATAARLGLEFPYGVTTRVPLAERFFAGGSQTIRGFELDEAGPVDENGDPLGGEALLILNQEYRFPIWGPVRGVLFYDLGTVWATVDSIDLSELRHVLGTGVRLETPIGPIRFEYGWKVDRREGESPGAFYFSIGSLF